MSESNYRLVCVVLSLRNARSLEVVYMNTFWFAVLGRVDDLEGSLTGDQLVFGAVLVAKGMTADDNRLFPAGDETGDVGDDNGFTEDGPISTTRD